MEMPSQRHSHHLSWQKQTKIYINKESASINAAIILFRATIFRLSILNAFFGIKSTICLVPIRQYPSFDQPILQASLSRAISPEMRKIHVEFGGDGKTITERHGGDPMACYPIKTLQIPPHYKDLAREIKKSLQGPLGGMKKPEEVIAERRQKKDEECNHKSGDKDYFTGA